ncbi:MAG: methyltransferase domain-containing protein [Anaerolineales bacterium]|nr:methyltransferase domain-containing protein [Anaerolineales bacterium]
MSTGIQYDEAWSWRVEAIYTTSDVVAQRQAVLSALEPCPGERVLDIGFGPGFLAREIAAAVGTGGAVHGIDTSESMLALSQRRCAGLPWVALRLGDAAQLPYPDGYFDAAVSTQVYEYVVDVTAALRELQRVLRPGGRAVVLDTDWDSIVWHAANQVRMDRVLAAFTEHCAHPYLARTLVPRLRQAGFTSSRSLVFPLFNPRYDADTYSHGIIDFIAAFVPGHRGVTEAEAQAWADELRQLGQNGDYFFSLNRYLFCVEKPATSLAG